MAKYKLPRNKIDSGDNIRIRNIPDSEDFNLEQKIGEPLTGRKKVIILYPLSQTELNVIHNRFELKEKLEQRKSSSMPVHNIAGRGPEIWKLQRALHSDQRELIAVCGRRRVEKTYLVREFFDDRILS